MPMSTDDLKALVHGRTFVCGGGLDRAYFGSLHGDTTIWTTTAKVAGVGDAEPEFYVMNQRHILGSLGTFIKKAIAEDNTRYRLQNVIIETYNAQDIATWAIENQIPTEIVHATNTAQVPAFMELCRVVKKGRLYFSDTLTDLAREMETFVYELVNGQPRFGSDKWHDDRVYSLCWSLHSLRQREFAAYSLKSVICSSRSPHARLCYLRGGDMILHCANTCQSHIQVQQMFLQHRSARVESTCTLQDFFDSFVKVDSFRLYS